MPKAKAAPKPTVERPRSWEDCDRLLHLMAETSGQIAAAQIEADVIAHEVSEQLAERIGPMKALLEAIGERVETFAVGHKADFSGARSLALAHGRVGWRETPPAVKYLRPLEEVIASLKDRKLDVAILVTERASKEVLATFPADLLAEIGVRLTQRDEFYIDLAESPSSAAP